MGVEAEMERVSPFVAQPATPNWRRAALIFTAALAAVALATHVVAKHTPANDALLQTGALDARTARFEKDSSPEMEAQMLSRTQSLAPGKLGEPFFNAMHKMTGDYFASQGSSAGDCGVPGGATDRRRAGCIIPISGPTEDMSCCTSCCQGLMGECGPSRVSGRASSTRTRGRRFRFRLQWRPRVSTVACLALQMTVVARDASSLLWALLLHLSVARRELG